MSAASDSQAGFVAALQNPALSVPAGIEPAARFSVYRNNVFVSLVDAVAESFPVVARLVGEEFFHAMARRYVADNLPDSPLLLEYGASFPAFIKNFSPAAQLPYLADVAGLEWLRQRAYHAAEATPVEPQSLGAVDGEQLIGLQLKLHPSLQICSSRWPILDIWTSNQGEQQGAEVNLQAGGHDVAIFRPQAQVAQRLLPTGGIVFLQSLRAGRTLGEAARASLALQADFELAEMLSLLLAAGAIIDFQAAAQRSTETQL
jgi:hypothetical protein